jgi:hypothetical protein
MQWSAVECGYQQCVRFSAVHDVCLSLSNRSQILPRLQTLVGPFSFPFPFLTRRVKSQLEERNKTNLTCLKQRIGTLTVG